MTLFDFSSYISSLLSLPQDQINIQVLAGGYTNVTVRATFTPPIHLSQLGHSQSFGSVVLKYAPPFLATDPTQSLSVKRQVIEADALVLLSGTAIPAIAAVLEKFPNLQIPELIHHDKERSVLWITDLGDTLTLFDYLASDPAAQQIEQIATALGEFLAELFLATRNPSAETLSHVSPDSSAEAHSLLISAVRKVLTGADMSDAEQLAARVECSLQNGNTVEPCLGMVDFWPGSILINAHGNCGLVDWEYFGLSSASGELGMLGEIPSFFHLWLPTLRGCKSCTSAYDPFENRIHCKCTKKYAIIYCQLTSELRESRACSLTIFQAPSARVSWT